MLGGVVTKNERQNHLENIGNFICVSDGRKLRDALYRG
jgi:hypothetical protein